MLVRSWFSFAIAIVVVAAAINLNNAIGVKAEGGQTDEQLCEAFTRDRYDALVDAISSGPDAIRTLVRDTFSPDASGEFPSFNVLHGVDEVLEFFISILPPPGCGHFEAYDINHVTAANNSFLIKDKADLRIACSFSNTVTIGYYSTKNPTKPCHFTLAEDAHIKLNPHTKKIDHFLYTCDTAALMANTQRCLAECASGSGEGHTDL
ncbi:hypothetical protein PTSG_00146 [Salpingoeca rosetta]|uniref:ZP domain-containing protein n=1 Tax=Salpingoeca rosetta (strain ATCC 50818 / BSB-021) TaxID=946362 RepID=F2TVN0_SALR5|nr:uncharacterized protein PTSG_00146 [Salpingoeca rosetta]EGD72126.1 hypothetical protein PTSG_00146 [Salpingoeca rosetta]|eukprot:XP_004998698.1 hypothetical protein PTSG_00146 [Salpingoeca rosetta]